MSQVESVTHSNTITRNYRSIAWILKLLKYTYLRKYSSHYVSKYHHDKFLRYLVLPKINYLLIISHSWNTSASNCSNLKEIILVVVKKITNISNSENSWYMNQSQNTMNNITIAYIVPSHLIKFSYMA